MSRLVKVAGVYAFLWFVTVFLGNFYVSLFVSGFGVLLLVAISLMTDDFHRELNKIKREIESLKKQIK